jgi:hypothetical protein
VVSEDLHQEALAVLKAEELTRESPLLALDIGMLLRTELKELALDLLLACNFELNDSAVQSGILLLWIMLSFLENEGNHPFANLICLIVSEKQVSLVVVVL